MSLTWRGAEPLPPSRPTPAGWTRAVGRGVPLLLLLGLGFVAAGAMRAIERPFRSSWSPWIAVFVSRGALRLLGLRVLREGAPTAGAGAFLANHSSWLDILVLNAQAPMVFVAKSEVRAWPGIGWLARATDTMFVRREARRDAAAQAHEVAMRLRKGQRLALFPEGTSTDNQRVLTFRSTLLAGLLRPDVRDGIQVQPVTLSYGAPPGEDRRFLAWYGNADFGPHALAVLSARRTGSVRVTFHPPLPVEGRDRKSLAAQAEAAVRSAL